MNEAEAEAFRSWCTAGLTRAPDATLAALSASYSPSRIAAARSVLMLAATLSDAHGERWIEPDGPGPACGHCGRTDPAGTKDTVLADPDHLPDSLADMAGRVGLKDESVPGSEPEYACTDTAKCDQVRQRKLTEPPARDFVRPFATAVANSEVLAPHHAELAKYLENERRKARQQSWEAQSREWHAERQAHGAEPLTGYQSQGYQGKAFEHAPAWLTPMITDAGNTLAGLDIARECIALAMAQEDDSDFVGLTRGGDGTYVPALQVPFPTWHGTLAQQASRAHLVGAQWAATGHTLPDSLHIPAAQASETRPRKPAGKPNARSREIERMRARRKQLANRFRHRP